jgi:hypothetical protein
MYSNKLVCSVKVNNKILREKTTNNESTVYVPFGSEYSLLLKNLGGRNAVVNIEIDGRKVTKGGFYINAGQTAEIERFVDSLTEGRRFKFIEKTDEISEFRGDKIDDGMIRVTWQFEAAKPEVVKKTVVTDHYHNHHHHHGFGCRCWICSSNIWYGPITYTKTSQPIPLNGEITYTSCNANIGSAMNAVMNSSSFDKGQLEGLLTRSLNENDSGITVEGSKSNQKFSTTYANMLEENVHSMVIILKGTRDSIPVQKPIVVSEKLQCSTCGRKWASNFEFCAKCGTALKD